MRFAWLPIFLMWSSLVSTSLQQNSNVTTPGGASRTAGQPLSLSGNWRGYVTVGTQKLPVEFLFGSDGTVKINDGEQKAGTFILAANKVAISFSGPGGRSLAHIRINHQENEHLSGVFSIEGEPSELAATIELSRSVDGASSPRYEKGTSTPCSISDLPAEVTTVLARYAISCPIHIQHSVTHVEGIFFSKVFREILNAVLKPSFEVQYSDKGIFTVRGDHSSMPEVEQVIKPLLSDPDAIQLQPYSQGCPFGRCALEIAGYSSLKPQYRRGESINFFEIWTAVVQIAQKAQLNLIPPGKMPPFSASTGLAPIVTGPNGIIYERVSISVEDAYSTDKAMAGKYVQIHVKSEIWRRPGFAVKRAFRIEEECSSKTGEAFNITCSDRALIEAIFKQISNYSSLL